MYTVKELIEALKQCPEDYEVVCIGSGGLNLGGFEMVGINKNNKNIELFVGD